MIRGISYAAVLAGWELSYLIGPAAGEVLAVIIFLLGVSAVNISDEIGERKLKEAGKWIISLIYILVSGEMNHARIETSADHIIIFTVGIIDCVVMLMIINSTEENKRYFIAKIISLTALQVIIEFIKFPHFKAEILHPLLASLLTGMALIRITNDELKVDLNWLFVGMSGVMLYDAVF